MNNIYSPDQSILEKVQDSVYRIYLLAKRDILENWRSYLLSMLAIYVVFLMSFISRLYYMSAHYERYKIMYGADNTRSFSDFKNSLEILFFVTVVLMFFMAAARTFYNKNKGETITMLSLPAKSYEKFTANLLVRFVAFFLFFYITINLADLTRLLYQPAHTESVNHLMINKFCQEVFIGSLNIGRIWRIESILFLCVCLGSLLLQSFCFLGSALWNEQAIKKTIVLFVVVLIVGLKLFSTIVEKVERLNESDWRGSEHNLIPKDEQTMALGLCILASVILSFTIVNYALTYRIYKNRTLKNRAILSFRQKNN